jgi:hypothetical protein
MLTHSNDDLIQQHLRKAGLASAESADFEKAWLKIEDRLQGRKRHFWTTLVWKPWAPGNWAVMALGLCVAVIGLQIHLNRAENTELDSYLADISNPTANIASDSDESIAPALLTEASTRSSDVLLADDEDRLEVLQPLYQ